MGRLPLPGEAARNMSGPITPAMGSSGNYRTGVVAKYNGNSNLGLVYAEYTVTPDDGVSSVPWPVVRCDFTYRLLQGTRVRLSVPREYGQIANLDFIPRIIQVL